MHAATLWVKGIPRNACAVYIRLVTSFSEIFFCEIITATVLYYWIQHTNLPKPLAGRLEELKLTFPSYVVFSCLDLDNCCRVDADNDCVR